MRNCTRELYMFLEATTIHGLAYLSHNQNRCTRIIWTIIVLTAFGIASYFLYETIQGFDTKYTSTTIEDRNIKEYPFPAITFDPGEFNLENAFTRTFLHSEIQLLSSKICQDLQQNPKRCNSNKNCA